MGAHFKACWHAVEASIHPVRGSYGYFGRPLSPLCAIPARRAAMRARRGRGRSRQVAWAVGAQDNLAKTPGRGLFSRCGLAGGRNQIVRIQGSARARVPRRADAAVEVAGKE